MGVDAGRNTGGGTWGGRAARRPGLLAMGLMAAVVWVVATGGCGYGQSPTSPGVPSSQAVPPSVTDTGRPRSTAVTETGATRSTPATDVWSASTDAPPTEVTTTGPSASQASGIGEVFSRLAADLRPMRIYSPGYLPSGAVLGASWWPVIEQAIAPAPEDGVSRNPRVLGEGAGAEVQVIIQTDGGWLAILENFQGDLGDVSGTPVGSIAGSPAVLYELNGGWLAQWSHDGRWYGVFGRGVARDEVVMTALDMRPE